MMEVEIFNWIAAGGDIGIVAVLFFLYKLDRRVAVVEMALKTNQEEILRLRDGSSTTTHT